MRPIFTTITIQWSIFLQGDKVGKLLIYLFILFLFLFIKQAHTREDNERHIKDINKGAQ